MRRKQKPGRVSKAKKKTTTQPETRVKYRHYGKQDLLDAYDEVTIRHMPIKRAAKKFSVPESTLRDRIKGRISVQTQKSGKKETLPIGKEKKLREHIANMASIGYRFKKSSFIKLATDFAVSLGRVEASRNLSYKWLEGFLARAHNKVALKPGKVDSSAKNDITKECMDNYYLTLETLLAKYDLTNKPHLIYYVEESVLMMTESSGKGKGRGRGAKAKQQTQTSCVTIIGGGSAIGSVLPQYFIFPGQKLSPSLLSGAGHYTSGSSTSNGCLSAEVFKIYLEKHFLLFSQGRNSPDFVMVLYDGNLTCINPEIIEWALHRRIVLFALPPHYHLLLKFLDVEVFGGLKEKYLEEIDLHRELNPSLVLRKGDIASICGTAYKTVMTANNLQSAFAETGIHPSQPKVVFYCLEDPYADSETWRNKADDEDDDDDDEDDEEDSDADQTEQYAKEESSGDEEERSQDNVIIDMHAVQGMDAADVLSAVEEGTTREMTCHGEAGTVPIPGGNYVIDDNQSIAIIAGTEGGEAGDVVEQVVVASDDFVENSIIAVEGESYFVTDDTGNVVEEVIVTENFH